ncbi:MAG: Nramp family divalent metal transporter [Anaerolineae bacterium]
MLAVIGPGAILLGVSIGSGEWLLGPAAFVRYGLTLLWVTLVAVVLQTLLNTELVRYTLYTGEPVFTGFIRTWPGRRFWAACYVLLYFFQVGWPGWAGAAAGAIFYLFLGRLAGPADLGVVYAIGVAAFLGCAVILAFGRHIERTLEVVNWVLVILILGALFMLCVVYVAPATWLAAIAGLVGYDVRARAFIWMPRGADWLLVGAFAAYSGAGGVVNLMLSSWVRDRGMGMSSLSGYIPAAIGGRKQTVAHVGTVFSPTPANLAHWRAWWRIVQIDQWGVFGLGALLAMLFLAMLYAAFVPAGQDIRGPIISAVLADAMAARGNVALTFLVALIGAWVLFKTQLDILDGTARAVTDIAWAGSRHVRTWRGGDVRAVYYSVLAALVVWGMIALRLVEPILLLEIGANIAGVAFVIIALHVLRLNTTRLPPPLRPALWRRAGLVLLALFYGSFVYLWLLGGLAPDPQRGFLFTLLGYLGL